MHKRARNHVYKTNFEKFQKFWLPMPIKKLDEIMPFGVYNHCDSYKKVVDWKGRKLYEPQGKREAKKLL